MSQNSPVLSNAVLKARGIEGAAHKFGAVLDGKGVMYPVWYSAVDEPSRAGTRIESVWRWKALDRTPDENGKLPQKYLWKKPDKAYFPHYYIHPLFVQSVQKANGAAWLVNGEPAVWAMYAAGIHNAFCTFGEQHIVDLKALRALGIRNIIHLPDCDDAGKKNATATANVLKGSEIGYKALALPFDHASKQDTNDLWIKVEFDAEAFSKALSELPIQSTDLLPQPSLAPVSASAWDDWKDKVARQLGVVEYNSKGWSNHFKCPNPSHQDDTPSANWSKDGVCYCFNCGSFTRDQIVTWTGIALLERQHIPTAPPQTTERVREVHLSAMANLSRSAVVRVLHQPNLYADLMQLPVSALMDGSARAVWTAIQSVYARSGNNWNIQLIRAELEAMKMSDEVDAAFWLARPDDRLSVTAAFRSLMEQYNRQAMTTQLVSVIEALRSGASMDNVIQVLSEVSLSPQRASVKKSADADDMLEAYRNSLTNPRHAFGLRELDALGFPDNGLFFVGGMQGFGKTWFLVNLLVRMAEQGRGSMYLSSEMSAAQMMTRFLSVHGDVSAAWVKDGFPDRSLIPAHELDDYDEQLRRYKASLGFWKENRHAVSFLDWSPSLAALKTMLNRYIEKLDHHHRKFGILFVDYVGMLWRGALGSAKGNNDSAMLESYIYQLKALSQELNIVIVAASQFNREGNSSGNPSLWHFSGSSAVESAADLAVALLPSDTPSTKQVNVLKYRHGSYAPFFVGVNPLSQRLYDVSSVTVDLSNDNSVAYEPPPF